MAFEKAVLDKIKFEVAVAHNDQIDPWFENGSVWCDYINKDVANTIKNAIEDYTHTEVIPNVLKATTTEPWDQWVFDITDTQI